MNSGSLRCAAFWLGLAAGAAHAEAGLTADGERERIARERAAVEAKFVEHQAECQGRFAVTGCVDEAKRERRQAEAPLRRQAIALDDAQRKQKAAERLASVRSKVGNAQSRQREQVVREAPTTGKAAAVASDERTPVAARQARHKPPPKPPPKPATTRAPRAATAPLDRRAEEAAGQARIDARKLAAQTHREVVEQRNAKRAVSGKRAAPLPSPLPASAAVP